MTDDFASVARSLEDQRMAKPLLRRKPQRQRTKPNRHSEDDFSCQVNKLFCAIFDPERVVFYHVPNGGTRGEHEGGRLKNQGVKRGIYDWHLHWRGYFENDHEGLTRPCTGCIELKSVEGKLRPEQRLFRARMEAMGHFTAVCRTLDEVLATLKLWGVPTRIAS